MVLENTQKCLVSLAQLLDIALYICGGNSDHPIYPTKGEISGHRLLKTTNTNLMVYSKPILKNNFISN
jgi:hypothetical protein